MRRVLVLSIALVLAGCGGGSGTTFGGTDVERAFRAAGIELRPVPSNGAEQPAMGMTSACASQFVASTAGAVINVAVCDDASAAASAGGRLRRANVAVRFTGSGAVESKIQRALDGLD
jgi:hypothetical protein